MSAALEEAFHELAKEVRLLRKAQQKPAREAWKPTEVAQKLGYADRRPVLDLIHAGKLGAIEVNGQYLVPDAELQRFLAPGIKQTA
jgi:hypothetical protein